MTTCTASWPVQNCAAQNITSDRGICVQPLAGTYECWDVCDPGHNESQQYQVVIVPPGGGNATVQAMDRNKNVALMINRIRHGRNLDVSCGTAFADVSEWCKVGHRCGGDATAGPTTAHAQSIPANRGICVVDPSGPYGRACWDMCNYHLIPSKYAEGSPNAEDIVNAVRGGSDSMASCPHFNVWPWILGVLLALCIIAGIATFVMKGYARRMMKRTRALDKQPMDFDPVVDFQDARDQQLDEAERSMESQPPPMPELEPPMEQKRDLDLPPVPEATLGTSHWQGKIPGLDEPHLFPQAGRTPIPGQSAPQTMFGQAPALDRKSVV